VTFEQFVVSMGDTVHKGDAVALALTAEGMMDHCRAPDGGQVEPLHHHIQQGLDMTSLVPSMSVACVRKPGLPGAGLLPKRPQPSQLQPAANGGRHRTCPGSPPVVAESSAKAAAAGKHAAASGAAGPAHGAGESPKTDDGVKQHANRSASSKPARAQETMVSVRRRLPLANIGQQMASDKGLAPISKQQSPMIARSSGLVCVIWALLGLVAISTLLLGSFLMFGKSQTRSLYMLMQDSREEVSKGLRLDFLDGSGSEKSFMFEHQPLGIVFTKHSPIRVERFEFNSYAKDKGVQLGWSLVRVANQQVTSEHSLPDVDRMLQSHMKNLAYWPLRVDFDTGNGLIKAFHFVKQPLGVEITRHAPFKITLFKPDSYAKTCGVELGWVIVRIGDAVVNQRTNFNVLSAYFENGLSHLPQEPKGVRIDFSDPGTGKEKTFYFQRRPLGMVLTKYKPIRVQSFDFNSYARERGVQPGWTITRIGDQPVPSGSNFEQVDRRITESTANLAVWPLRLDLDTGRGIRTFYFEKQPLGMELLNKLPIKVDTFKPDSYAKACGVQLGWVITRVGDHEVTRETKFEQVIEYLVEGVCELPPVDAHLALGRQTNTVQRGPRSSAC